MRRKPAVSNEELISALLQCGTVKAAAALVGLRPRTIYDRMKREDFLREYREARRGLLNSAVHGMTKNLANSVETILAIMDDRKVNPATRLKAAATILEYARHYIALVKDDDPAEQEFNDVVICLPAKNPKNTGNPWGNLTDDELRQIVKHCESLDGSASNENNNPGRD